MGSSGAMWWLGTAGLILVACASDTFTFGSSSGQGGTGASSGGSGGTASSSGGGTTSTSGTGGSTSSSGSTSGTGGGTTTGNGGTGGTTTTPPCDESPCKLTAPQCGCQPGFKCTIEQGQRICAPLPSSPSQLGELCNDDCEAGTICTVLDGVNGVCRAFCDDHSDCQGPGALCLVDLPDGQGGVTPDAQACTISCNLITSAGCVTPTMKCTVAQDPTTPGSWLTACWEAGSNGQGAGCTATSQCAPGYGCLSTGTQYYCLQWCNTAAPVCPSGTSCHSINPPMVIGPIEYGACL